MLPALRLYLIAGLSLLVWGGSSAEGQVAVPTATLTVNGTEQQPGGNWDAGNIQVDFNGYVEIVNYAEYSTNVSLASALAAMFVRDYHSFGLYAKAGANGTAASVITFQLVNNGTFGPLNVVDPSVSFTLSGSGFASSSATTADIGTATLNVNGSTVSTANYGDGSTGVSVAESLAQNANSPLVAVTSDGPNLYLQVKGVTGSYSYPYALTYSTNLSFSNASGTLSSSTEVSPIAVYSYCIGPVDPCPSSGGTSGYLGNSNIQSINDSVMGSWTYGYDSLSRIKSGVASSGPYASASTCWSYDSFGNRTSQSVSSAACGSTPPSTFAAQYSSLNQISLVTTPTSTTVNYDKAGNVTGDGVNTYTYDAEGRVCALNGPQGMIGYQYDASGNRIGKGTVTNFLSCDITANGYSPMTDYVLDQSGSQMTEMAISTSTSGTTASWIHSDVSADGSLIASYDNNPNATGGVLGGTSIAYGLHFYLNDALGSRRVQTDATGIPEQICRNLPFGDQLHCTGSLTSPTENHFTGKERDTESGLDYFGARYYGSSMGRFMSPDPSMEGAILELPQTWNKYSYEYNRPTYGTDPDGRCPPCIGAIVGGFVEGGFDLGKQLLDSKGANGDLSKVKWKEVGANALGGAVAGGLAVATGGTSLIGTEGVAASEIIGDIAGGATGTIVGGAVTRATDPSTPSGDVFSAGEVSEDAVAGFVGGAAGHIAADMVHMPEEPRTVRTRSGSVYRRQMAKRQGAVNARNWAIASQFIRSGIASSFTTHSTNGGFDWLFKGPCYRTSATDSHGNSTGLSGCQ